MVHSAPKVVSLTVDLHENFVDMPLPVARAHHFDPAIPNLALEHRTEPMPPKPNCFAPDTDAAIMKQIFEILQQDRIPNIQHDRQADNLGARFECLERGRLVIGRRYPASLHAPS